MRKIILLMFSVMLLAACGGNRAKEYADTLSRSDADIVADSAMSGIKIPDGRKFVENVSLNFTVKNTLDATHAIEKLTYRMGGYILKSDVQAVYKNSKLVHYTSDSMLNIQQVSYVNTLVLKVPTSQVDSFLVTLRPLIKFLSYRTIELEDVTHKLEADSKVSQAYGQAVKSSDLKEDRKLDSKKFVLDSKVDAALAKSIYSQLKDNVQMATITVEINQDPIIYKRVEANFDSIATDSQGFFSRLGDSFLLGWYILKEFILFLVKMWAIAIFIGIVFIGYKIVKRRIKDSESSD